MSSELTLSQAFIDAHSDDAARVIERLEALHSAALLEALPADTAARALGRVAPTVGAECLGRLAPDAAAAIVARLPADQAAGLLRRLDAAPRTAILAGMPNDEAAFLSAILTYRPGTAGALMDSRVIVAGESVRAGDALAQLRRAPPNAHEVFVIDEARRLIGTVHLRDLLSVRPRDPLSAIVDRTVSRVPASAGRAAIVTHPGWKRSHTLAVVDGDLLVGAISHATLRAIVEEDALGGSPRPGAATIVALGELYWLGLSGVVDGVASAVRETLPRLRAASDHHDRA